jgi:hypothetical protein
MKTEETEQKEKEGNKDQINKLKRKEGSREKEVKGEDEH